MEAPPAAPQAADLNVRAAVCSASLPTILFSEQTPPGRPASKDDEAAFGPPPLLCGWGLPHPPLPVCSGLLCSALVASFLHLFFILAATVADLDQMVSFAAFHQ